MRIFYDLRTGLWCIMREPSIGAAVKPASSKTLPNQ